MLVSARIVPTNTLPVWIVAEDPTCQKTLQLVAPLIKETVEPVAVVRVLPIWKIHCGLLVPCPSSVNVPVRSADEEKQ
jgi:hypothetical protein